MGPSHRHWRPAKFLGIPPDNWATLLAEAGPAEAAKGAEPE
jgi:hypothetical protein